MFQYCDVTTGKAGRLRVLSPMFDEDEIPVTTLFRQVNDMPLLERKAVELASGNILDVGAGAGCHTLALQSMGKAVTAIDISPLCVETMRERGVHDVHEQDFFTLQGQYDTILMLMNGIGIVGTLNRLPAFFMQLDALLTPGGKVLCDSSDLCYIYEDEDGIIDLTGVEAGVIKKSGAWFSWQDQRLGQGREAAKQFLIDNSDTAAAIEAVLQATA